MPRTTKQQYLQSHHYLHEMWNAEVVQLAYLLPAEQWCLHDYFRLSEPLPDKELLRHRRQIAKERPALPQQAGRALSHLTRMLESGTAVLPTAVVHKKRVIRLGSVVRPQIDLELLAQAIVLLAEDIARDADRADAFVRQRGGGPE